MAALWNRLAVYPPATLVLISFHHDGSTISESIFDHSRLNAYKALKGDCEAKAVTVDQSPAAAVARASEIRGLPRDDLEVHPKRPSMVLVKFLKLWSGNPFVRGELTSI